MLEKFTYKIISFEYYLNGRNVVFEVKNDFHKFQIEMFLEKDVSSVIEFMDELVRCGSFGKLSYNEFLSRVQLNMSPDYLSDLYEDCKYVDYNMSKMFGDYEGIWNPSLDIIS
jgi:hypothetical protein